MLNALKDYFFIKSDTILKPLKLAFFLDHSYTAHSLHWNMLKGADRVWGLALRKAAQELCLTPHLALVEIHESWATEEEDENPLELLVTDETFSDWIDEKGEKLSYGDLSISSEEICSMTENNERKPYEAEHEGWM